MNRIWEDTFRAFDKLEDLASLVQSVERCATFEDLAVNPELTDTIGYQAACEVLGPEDIECAIARGHAQAD